MIEHDLQLFVCMLCSCMDSCKKAKNGGCEVIKQEMSGSDQFSTEYNMFPLLHSIATS